MKEMSRKISDMRDDGIVRRREELGTPSVFYHYKTSTYTNLQSLIGKKL